MVLLKWSDSFEYLTDNDAIDFFVENEKFIMSVYGQYSAMFPELEEEELSVMTVLYLIYGEDDDVPDRKLNIPDEAEDLILNNEFVSGLTQYITTAGVLASLTYKKLIKVEIDKKTGEKYFSLTALGGEAVYELNNCKKTK